MDIPDAKLCIVVAGYRVLFKNQCNNLVLQEAGFNTHTYPEDRMVVAKATGRSICISNDIGGSCWRIPLVMFSFCQRGTTSNHFGDLSRLNSKLFATTWRPLVKVALGSQAPYIEAGRIYCHMWPWCPARALLRHMIYINICDSIYCCTQSRCHCMKCSRKCIYTQREWMIPTTTIPSQSSEHYPTAQIMQNIINNV